MATKKTTKKPAKKSTKKTQAQKWFKSEKAYNEAMKNQLYN